MRKLLTVLISTVLFYSCQEELDFNSIFETDSGNIDPNTTIETEVSDIDPTNSTVTLNWKGNDFSNAFNYKLVLDDYIISQDYFDWLEDGEWTNNKSITFEDLDEGSYTFYVKSRFSTEIEESAPDSLEFTINAISGPALRMYPLKQNISQDSNFDIYVFAEEIDNNNGVAFYSIQLSYEPDKITYQGWDIGTYESENTSGLHHFTLPDTADVENGIILIDGGVTGSDGVVGTKSIIKLVFTYLGSDEPTFIDFIGTETIFTDSTFWNADTESIPVVNRVPGSIEVD